MAKHVVSQKKSTCTEIRGKVSGYFRGTRCRISYLSVTNTDCNAMIVQMWHKKTNKIK